MTEDYTKAADKYALPQGMAVLAALITTGKSPFGYDLKRDGLPEVVIRAHERLGVEGLVGIARLVFDLQPAPRREAAAAFTEWSIEHYAGKATKTRRDSGLFLAYAAMGDLMERHYGSALREGTKDMQLGFDWVSIIEWPYAAQKAEEAGTLTFTSRETQGYDNDGKDVVVYEVHMFTGRWEGAQQ